MTDEQKRLVQGALVDADHLANCCEKMRAAMNRHHAAVDRGEVVDEADIEACAAALVELEQAEADVSEYWRAIRSAAYEYRKRAERARIMAQAMKHGCNSSMAPDGRRVW